MKKNLLLAICCLLTAFLFIDCFVTIDSSVYVNAKGDTLPNWHWTSGEVRKDSVAYKQAFTISFNQSIYKSGDSIKITFNSYKVSLTGITDATTFDRWTSKNTLGYWTSYKEQNLFIFQRLDKDTNARINKPFTGINNNCTDSLTNYQIRTVVPPGLTMTVSVSPGACTMNNINGHGKPMFTKGYQTLTTSIKGIQVEKL